MASISGDSIGERLPTTCSMNATSRPSASPTSSRTRRIVASPSMPGGTRQSTCSSAWAGITLIFSDAKMRVGTAVTRSMGSTIAARRGSISLTCAIAACGSDGS